MMPKFELDRLVSYDDAALLAELRRVAAIVHCPNLTQSTFDKLSKASSSLIRRRFGCWQHALTRADLQHRYTGTATPTRVTFTDERLISELRAVSKKLSGAPVTVELFNLHAGMNAETVRRRFGTWWAALQKAGLVISSRGKRYSEEHYFENLLTVWTHRGRQPKYGEMDRFPSTVPPGAYEAKWGTWTKALLAFLDRVNSDTNWQETNSAPAAIEMKDAHPRRTGGRARTSRAKDEDKRHVKLGLRYEVLKRDRFRCALCGASPATHLDCVLHVDHVIPFSKGGKTRAENLRSLCESCNLGKGGALEG